MAGPFSAGFSDAFGGGVGITEAELVKVTGTYHTFNGTTQTLVYRGFGDDPDQNIQDILDGMVALSSPDFPLPYAFLVGDPSSKAMDFQVDQMVDESGLGGGRNVYTIRVTFAPRGSRSASGGQPMPQAHNDNPLLWGAELRIERIPYMRKVEQARNVVPFVGPGNVGVWRAAQTLDTIVNTANFPVDGEYEEEAFQRVIVATKNYASIDAIDAVADTYHHTSNLTTWYDRPPGFARFLSINSGESFEYRGTVYYPATIRVALDEDDQPGGIIRVPNVGRKQMVDAGGGLAHWDYIYEDGQPISEPVPLQMNGQQYPPTPGSSLRAPPTLEYHNLEGSVEYSLLGIGS